jgi:subtilisin family serine protease
LLIGGAPVLASDNHGTAVAGVIAAEIDGNLTVGVAPAASLVSIYSPLSGSISTFAAEIVNAYTYARSLDILNDSWGFGNYSDLGSTFPWAFLDNFRGSTFAQSGQALKSLAELGRSGLGTIVVQSAGNSQSYGDDTNLHNFQNSRYIITVAATDYTGSQTAYSAPGASIILAAPGGGGGDFLGNIFTTDRVGNAGYRNLDYDDITGTSFSAPVISGVVALMLEANPRLGYRDVQQILAYTARLTASSGNDWRYNGSVNWNGGGLHYDAVQHNLGFGLVDAFVVAVFARQLDGRFVGFQARAAEKHVRHARELNQLGRQHFGVGHMEVVAAVDHLGQLVLEDRHQIGVVVTQGVHGNTGQCVEVLLAIDVPDSATLTMAECDRQSAIGVHGVR